MPSTCWKILKSFRATECFTCAIACAADVVGHSRQDLTNRTLTFWSVYSYLLGASRLQLGGTIAFHLTS
jgi:hypothetical protein